MTLLCILILHSYLQNRKRFKRLNYHSAIWIFKRANLFKSIAKILAILISRNRSPDADVNNIDGYQSYCLFHCSTSLYAFLSRLKLRNIRPNVFIGWKVEILQFVIFWKNKVPLKEHCKFEFLIYNLWI